MAAFSTITTNIFPHCQSPHRRRLLRGSICTSNLFKTYFYPKLPIKNLNYSNAHRAPPRVSTAATIAQEDSTSKSTTSYNVKEWSEFAEKVSGEWDGFGADFTAEGKPLELPESVVPEAYREWEVKVFDWQTQCPTLGQVIDNKSPSFIYKTIKLLPTVGCEADAATRYSVHERSMLDSSAFSFQYSTGCYVAVWPINPESVEVEHCLVDPRDKESRVRIIQALRLKEDSELTLQGIKVFVEQWYGPYRNGDQLGGCAIRDSAFAATQPLDASRITRVWQGLTATASFHGSENMIQQFGAEYVHESIRASDLILLPKQLWCSIRKCQNEKTECEVGWLLDDGRGLTSKCIFSSSGELKEIAISSETASVE